MGHFCTPSFLNFTFTVLEVEQKLLRNRNRVLYDIASMGNSYQESARGVFFVSSCSDSNPQLTSYCGVSSLIIMVIIKMSGIMRL